MNDYSLTTNKAPDFTIIRANEHFHHCSGGHFKIFPLCKVNTEEEEKQLY
jgi:hypothetical protein